MSPPTLFQRAEAEREALKLNLDTLEQAILLHSRTPLDEETTKTFLELAIQTQSTLMENQKSLLVHASTSAAIAGHTGEYVGLLSQAMRYVATLTGMKMKFPTPTTSRASAPPHPTNPSADIRLPRLQIPTFSGNLEEWMAFRDMFEKAIDSNGTLSKVQKLTYLKSYLLGEAVRHVSTLVLSDANYDVAWDTLKNRYQNDRELLFSILRRLFNQPNHSTASSISIRNLIDTTQGCVRSLQVLNVQTQHWDEILVFMMFNKLDQGSKELWEQSLPDSGVPKLKDFTDFLEQRARALAAGSTLSSQRPRQENRERKSIHIHHTQPSGPKCPLSCTHHHPLYKCHKFRAMDNSQRSEVIKKHSLCPNCMDGGHNVSSCPSKYTCRLCNKKHHTMIHRQDNQGTQQVDKVSSHHISKSDILQGGCLATARVKVTDQHGQPHLLRVLLDAGSPVSLIRLSATRKLGLKGTPTTTHINGVGATPACVSSATTSFSMQPHFNSRVSYTVNALIVPQISESIPSLKLRNETWNHLDELCLADPDYASPSHVDILIGSELFWSLLKSDKITGPPKSPYAIHTTLGWIVAGRTEEPIPHNITTFVTTVQLDERVQRFWEAESVPEKPLLTPEERKCEQHFAETHFRDHEGRFNVSIPWKSPRPAIGTSRTQAMQLFYQLERRLNGNNVRDLEKLRKLQRNYEEYKNFMAEYESMGHMTLIPEKELLLPASKASYIPHHFVEKEDSTTTRLRVVFNASFKTSSGNSLNDSMMVGPTLQDSLHHILLRFRKYSIGFTADIAKMYRQIRVSPDDAQMQRILWRSEPTQPVKEYRLNTVTYGTASAPYLAVKCLQQLAVDERSRFPIASNLALQTFYVDDQMGSETTTERAISAIKEMNQMCATGGFELRKWSSNSPEVIASIPEHLRETSSVIPLNDDNSIVKTLGVFWNTTQDCYQYVIKLPEQGSGNYTKRIILSEVSTIFDPLGWVAPVIMTAKILLQDIWKTKADWNDDIPDHLQQKWQDLKNSLKQLEQIRIPRCILPGEPTKTILCGFSDSSEKGYAAVVYTICYYPDREPVVTLVTSKTKVAPIQQLTIARLELSGAVLLARLLHSINEALLHKFDDIHAYTDSTIVLAWVTSSPLRWKTYIRNRVQQLQDFVPTAKWFHVPGEDNPADCASRGIFPPDLIHHHLWWTGNQHMKRTEKTSAVIPIDVFDAVKEEEQAKIPIHSISIDEAPAFINKFSSFTKLARVTAWMFRFTNNTRRKQPKQTGPLSVDELQQSQCAILRLVQSQSFAKELHCLKANSNLPESSKILPLNPFMDPKGILRVGGRLRNSNCPHNQKYPVLLPPKHHITTTIIQEIHSKYFHAGPQLMMSIIQRRYWIINCRDVVRRAIRTCTVCVRHRATAMKQMMGDLPVDRVNPSQPFSKCGVDYAGPILTRPPIRSKTLIKSWLAIFVCFATRAIHIEIVQSLSTSSFLAALRRFTSRRGKPSDIFSDNGSNFIGANKEINQLLALCQSGDHNEAVTNACTTEGIRWHFTPPGSPHFGGLWEAGVRSIKYHLNRIIGSSHYTYEELLTLMNQIEALLNSRPLVPASNDPSDLEALTPSHLISGAPVTDIPDPDLTTLKEGRLDRWQKIQQQKQYFWRRWSNEFITRLQNRPKWMKRSAQLKIKDMVIVKEDNLPPAKWNLGRVIAVHPGADGNVRVATIRTTHGDFKRAIHRLCLLPIEQATSSA